MSNLLFSRAMCAVAASSVVALAGSAHGAITTSFIPDDASFAALGLSEVFEAQGRIGNAATNGTQEADLGPSTSAPVATAQFAWGSNQPVDFTLSYDIGTNLVTWTIFGQAMQYVAAEDPIELAIRVRATTQRDNIAVHLSDMDINGFSIPSISAMNPGDGVEYLRIQGSSLQSGFTLTGRATMVFDQGNPPTNSNLAFQIKGVVPAPGACTVAAMGLMTLARRRRG